MTRDVLVSSRLNRALKFRAEAILAELSLKSSQANLMFYSQLVKHRGIRLEIKIPNEETIAAVEELMNPKTRKRAKRFSSVKRLM